MKTRFAVIGCGHIGLRHMDFILANPQCELTAICDIHPPTHLPADVPFFTSIAEFMTKDFDVCCIATPNGLHENHALTALRHGHHVLIEKPMALTTAACERIMTEAARQGRQVFCVMQNRYSAPSVWLKELLHQKKLGRIFLVSVNCFWNRDHRYYKQGGWRGTRDLDGGVLFTQFSHFIDSLLWLFGDIRDINAQLRNFSHTGNTELDDSGVVQFSFTQGGIGCLTFTTSVWEKNLESSLTVIAEKGTVRISGQYMDQVTVCNIADYTLPATLSSAGDPGNHRYVFGNITDVLTKGAIPHVKPEEAARIVTIIEQIYSKKTDH